MSASGHPMMSCLPPIDDNVEYQRSVGALMPHSIQTCHITMITTSFPATSALASSLHRHPPPSASPAAVLRQTGLVSPADPPAAPPSTALSSKTANLPPITVHQRHPACRRMPPHHPSAPPPPSSARSPPSLSAGQSSPPLRACVVQPGRLAKMPGAARSFIFNCCLFVPQEFLR